MDARRTARPARTADRPPAWLPLLVGPVAVVVVAAVTQSVREDMGIANVALVLAMVTVAAALSSFWAGLATSVVAAGALNYFHTEPVHSLRITSGSDLLAVSLLAAMGVGVSVATALRVRRTVVGRHADGAAAAARRLEAMLGTARPAVELWHGAIDAGAAQLANVDARLAHGGTASLPVIARRRRGIDDDSGEHLSVTLPEGGAIVQFLDPRRTGQLVLSPRAGLGAVSVERRTVFAFADHLEAVLTAPESAVTA